MNLAPQHVAYHHDPDSGVATITFKRPERLNALTFEVYAELRDLFHRLDTEPGVRAVIITGTGRGFCTGGDVETIIGRLFDRSYEDLLAFTRMTCDVIANIRRCRRPVIAAPNDCLGPRLHADLAVEPANVIANGSFAQIELNSDLAIGQPFRYMSQDRHLLGG